MNRNHYPSQNPATSSSRSSSSSSYSNSNSRHHYNVTRTSGPKPNWNRISNRPQRVPLEEDTDYTTAHCIVGTCPFMCPEKERIQREQLRDLAVFERLNGNQSKSSSILAVKKFCRTISMKEVQASDIRPLPVLEDTLDYLMKLDSSEHSFLVLHDFISDRTRSIRQDLSMQNINNDKVICMYEKMIRFHVTSHYKLRRCEGDSTTLSSIHHLNMEQLTKCLGSLYNLYDINRTSDSVFDNEAEYRSLYVLLHLETHSHSTGESLSLWFSRLSSYIVSSKEMCFARTVLRSFRMGNFWRFFHTVASEATNLQFCIIEPYIMEVRALAVACINSSGYKLHPYPLTSLSKILMIKQTGFSHPKGGFQCNLFPWLELLEKDASVSIEK
ncbi:SAC3 family protein C-like isoform X2 [Chenopodium quinoa]|uniref:SAC3 family protein C-like isoform X2 n=1 Tax=Chenopodium quinoa TaxID=63459 RepID=UPI000B76ED22|nr:SAC3 family protein C-like isoform X2 [Chenopodium quinoa]